LLDIASSGHMQRQQRTTCIARSYENRRSFLQQRAKKFTPDGHEPTPTNGASPSKNYHKFAKKRKANLMIR